MSLLGVLGMGRQFANSRMTETVRVGTLTETTDPDTLDPVQVFEPVYGEGATAPNARMKFVTQTIAERDAASQLVAVQTSEVHLPSGTLGITTDMRVIVDASTADAGLVGRVFRIKGFPHAGQTTAARFAVEETGEQIQEES